MANVAPKNRTYCRSKSLMARICLVVGQNNMGRSEFWKLMLQDYFGLEPPSSLMIYLKNKEENLSKRSEYKATVEVKSRRINNYITSLKLEIEKQKRDKSRGATYLGKGEGLNNIIGSSGRKEKKNHPGGIDVGAIRQDIKCGSCGGLGHSRRSSKLCDQNHATKLKKCPFCGELGHINPFSSLCLKNPLIQREVDHNNDATSDGIVEGEVSITKDEVADSANGSAMRLNENCTDEQTTEDVDESPEQYSQACGEIQFIDECLYLQNDDTLKEIDDLFD